MKIKNLATLAFIGTTFVSTVLAQDDKITTSKEFEFNVGEPYPVVDAAVKSYASKDGNVVSFKMTKGEVTLQKFDGPGLAQTSVKVYEDFPKGTVYEDDIDGNDYVFLLYSVWDRSNQTEQLFIRKIDKSTGDFDGDGTRIIAVDGKVTGGDGNKFKLAQSFDKSKILVYYRKKPESRNDKINKDVIGLYSFDKDLNKLWGKDVEMPYTEARMDNIDYAIDGKGNVLILTEVLKEGETRKYSRDDEPNFTYQLVVVSESGVDVNASDVDVNGKYVTQVNFYEGKDDALLLAGFYGNKRGRQVDGLFYCSVSSDGKQTGFKTYEIPTDVIKQFMSQRAQDRMEKKEDKGKDIGLTNMRIREITFEKDGSVLISAEEYYMVVRHDSKTNMTYYDHHYKDILIAKIDKNGELAFWKKMPKYQYAGGTASPLYRGGMGYRLVDTQKYYYFMFLDNVKNLELALNKPPVKHQDGYGGFLTAYQVDKATGEVKKLSILDTRDAKGYNLYQFNTERIVMISDNVMAIEAYIKKKQDMMVSVTIKE
jgi:hypothetical protein